MTQQRIENQLNTIPASPGVYLFKNHEGTVIYVGKAISLTGRVRSYFSQMPSYADPGTVMKLQRLVPQIEDIEFIVTDSEHDALILENTLIKKFNPKFNVRLKDGKTYPYLKIDIQNDWPTVRVTRNYVNDGSRYFGPFASAFLLRRTVNTIKRIFPFRSCNNTLGGKQAMPWLQDHMPRCLGPCTGSVAKADYAYIIKQVILFLEGKQESILKELKRKMRDASQNLHYEQAAVYRDQVEAIESIIESQKSAAVVHGDMDAIAFAQDNDIAYFEIFFIRSSKITGRDYIVLDGVRDEPPEKVMSSFIKLYYSSAPAIPPVILMQYNIEEKDIIAEWLAGLRGTSISIEVPQRGKKKQFMCMVVENAAKGFELYRLKKAMSLESMETLSSLKDILTLRDIRSASKATIYPLFRRIFGWKHGGLSQRCTKGTGIPPLQDQNGSGTG
jgi:excinuclease ABC subunit C